MHYSSLIPRSRWGFFIGLISSGLCLLFPPPAGLTLLGWHTLAIAMLMACWWITETYPLWLTALIPLFAIPLLQIDSLFAALKPFFSPTVFLFMGGFMIALGIQHAGLHRRIALSIVYAVGTEPKRIILGFILATALLSMWISNTATTLMMLPIATAIIGLINHEQTQSQQNSTFAIVLLLSIAYSATIGGLATLIGTPPNAFMAAFLANTYNIHLSFARWLLFGLPLVCLALPCLYFLMTRLAFSFKKMSFNTQHNHAFFQQELAKLGRFSRAEKIISIDFIIVALLWMSRPFLMPLLPSLSDAKIAMAGGLVLLFIPIYFSRSNLTTLDNFILPITWLKKLPWGILILFGGGLSLAAAASHSGLSLWLADRLNYIHGGHFFILTLMVIGLVLVMTEILSNIPTTVLFLPIVAAMAVGLGHSPIALVIPAALAASCAFMLPVATPPNAIVYSYSSIHMKHMLRAGFFLNILFIVLISLFSYYLLPMVFNVHI